MTLKEFTIAAAAAASAAVAAAVNRLRGGKLAALQLAGNPAVKTGYLIDPGAVCCAWY
jgi:hypothetical protein